VSVVVCSYKGKPKGFGFVKIQDETTADFMIENFNGYVLDGKKIVVEKAKLPDSGQRSL
jgi:RNA recognition motif-containing protein